MQSKGNRSHWQPAFCAWIPQEPDHINMTTLQIHWPDKHMRAPARSPKCVLSAETAPFGIGFGQRGKTSVENAHALGICGKLSK
jgi:hypothetical protein